MDNCGYAYWLKNCYLILDNLFDKYKWTLFFSDQKWIFSTQTKVENHFISLCLLVVYTTKQSSSTPVRFKELICLICLFCKMNQLSYNVQQTSNEHACLFKLTFFTDLQRQIWNQEPHDVVWHHMPQTLAISVHIQTLHHSWSESSWIKVRTLGFTLTRLVVPLSTLVPFSGLMEKKTPKTYIKNEIVLVKRSNKLAW